MHLPIVGDFKSNIAYEISLQSLQSFRLGPIHSKHEAGHG
jgi:hypothetical protein